MQLYDNYKLSLSEIAYELQITNNLVRLDKMVSRNDPRFFPQQPKKMH